MKRYIQFLVFCLCSFSVNAQVSIWGNTVPGTIDCCSGAPVELGVRFRSEVNGTIAGVRFYKSSNNTGTHKGSLWTSTGTLLATAVFINESPSGWQQVIFTIPVTITANTVYVASYHTDVSHFSLALNYFQTSFNNPPLHADNSNYVYSNVSSFPSFNYMASNYWVDVLFSIGASLPPLPTSSVTISSGASVTEGPCPPGYAGAKLSNGLCMIAK